MPSRALPARTDPYEHEFWGGYLDRVAARFGVGWADLMRPILPGQDLATARWHVGIFICRASAEELSPYFRLTSSEILGMHLASVFGNSAVVVSEARGAEFDPLSTVVPAGAHARITACGPIRNRDQQVVCSRCQDEAPSLRRLEWQVPWFPVCEKHALHLSADSTQIGTPSVHELITVQAELRYRLAPESANVHYFEHLGGLLRMLLHLNASSSLLRVSPTEIAQVLPAAVRGLSATGYPLSQGLVRSVACPGESGIRMRRGVQLRVRPAQVLCAPRSIQLAQPNRSAVATHPRRLPATAFAGTLSDLLCEPVLQATEQRTQRRVTPEEVAAVTVSMVRTGLDAESTTASLLQPGPRLQRRLASDVLGTLAQMEGVGRLEDYWFAVLAAARLLDRQDVDYGSRRQRLADPKFTDMVLATLSAPPDLVWEWLAREWACCAPPPHAPVHAPRSLARMSQIVEITAAMTFALELPARALAK